MTAKRKNYGKSCLLLLLVLSACGAEEPQATREEMLQKKMSVEQDAAGRGLNRVEIPQEELRAGIDPSVPDVLLADIRVDAAQRAKSTPDAVRILSARAEVWPDGAMGCPVPGQDYTHGQIRGYRIIASVGLHKFDYRAAENGRFQLCEPRLLRRPGLNQ